MKLLPWHARFVKGLAKRQVRTAVLSVARLARVRVTWRRDSD